MVLSAKSTFNKLTGFWATESGREEDSTINFFPSAISSRTDEYIGDDEQTTVMPTDDVNAKWMTMVVVSNR